MHSCTKTRLPALRSPACRSACAAPPACACRSPRGCPPEPAPGPAQPCRPPRPRRRRPRRRRLRRRPRPRPPRCWAARVARRRRHTAASAPARAAPPPSPVERWTRLTGRAAEVNSRAVGDGGMGMEGLRRVGGAACPAICSCQQPRCCTALAAQAIAGKQAGRQGGQAALLRRAQAGAHANRAASAPGAAQRPARARAGGCP